MSPFWINLLEKILETLLLKSKSEPKAKTHEDAPKTKTDDPPPPTPPPPTPPDATIT